MPIRYRVEIAEDDKNDSFMNVQVRVITNTVHRAFQVPI